MTGFRLLLALLAGGSLSAPAPVAADIFRLATGGELRGELLNKDEQPRKSYQVRTYLGVDVMLDAKQVVEVKPQSDNRVAYEQLRLKAPDTVEAHLKLAGWCGDNYLHGEREHHLRKVLELDYENADARRLLGYQKVDGKWMTFEEKMESQGFVYYKKRWRTPQEVQLIEEQQKATEAENRWKQQVDRWVGQLNTRRDPEARASLAAIDDVTAAPALADQLKRVRVDRDKELLAEVLIRLNTPFSVGAVVEASVQDESEDFRYDCLDLMERYKPPSATALYIKGLNKKYENHLINRAALGLGRLGDRQAIGPLIEALVTKHRRQIGGGGGGPGSIGSSFGRGSDGSFGPTGLSMGEGPKTVTEHLRNESVLKALVEISGQDFHYDVDAWKFWHARQNRAPDVIPGRRGP